MQDQQQQSETVTVEQFGSYQGRFHEQGGGYRFNITDPLVAALQGADLDGPIVPDDTDEQCLPNDTVGIRFDDPVEMDDGSQLMGGVIQTGDDVAGGRTYENQRRIVVSNRTLQVYLSEAMIDALGAGKPPLLDVWAGDGTIVFRTVETAEEITIHNVDTELAKLPEPLFSDVKATQIDGWDAGEWAEERGLPSQDEEGINRDPLHVVKQNVHRAADLLGGFDELEAAAEKWQEKSDDPKRMLFGHIGQSTIRHDEKAYSNHLPITQAVKQALDDPMEAVGSAAKGEGASLNFDIREGGEYDVPARIETGADAQVGTAMGRTIDADSGGNRFQVALPDSVLRELGIDPDDADGERVIILAAEPDETEDFRPIILRRPEQIELPVADPELRGQYEHDDEEYVEALQQAAEAKGEPLTVENYLEFKARGDHDIPVPTYRKVNERFDGFAAACAAANIESANNRGDAE